MAADSAKEREGDRLTQPGTTGSGALRAKPPARVIVASCPKTTWANYVCIAAHRHITASAVRSSCELRRFEMLEKFARYPLTFGPSYIQPLERLSAYLGNAVRLYAKREDCNSGLAFGGNKLRSVSWSSSFLTPSHQAPIPWYRLVAFSPTTLGWWRPRPPRSA